MGWYKVTFSVDEMVNGRHFPLCDTFAALMATAGNRGDVGMFKDADIMANAYYFSPGAAALAMPLIRNYAGVECEAPSRSAVKPVALADGEEGIPFSAF